MTRDEMFKLINSTGAVLNKYGFWEVEPDELESFFALVAAHEREACAVAAWSKGMDVHNAALSMPCDAREVGSKCAEAIRARGKS